MGVRLHYAKTYKVEWESGALRNEMENINRLLFYLCPNASFNEEDIDFSNVIEISRSELRLGLKKFKEIRKKCIDSCAEFDYDEYDVVEDFQDRFDDIEKFLTESINNSEIEDEYVHFEWF